MIEQEEAYIYGVFLGDGFLGKNQKKEYKYIMLKTVDKEFVERFIESLDVVFGYRPNIYTMNPYNSNANLLYACKAFIPGEVNNIVERTKGKTEIPNFVKGGDEYTKKAFIQGLMDSEGYITISLSTLKSSAIGLFFASTSSWVKDFWHLVRSVDIGVSKLYIRKMKDGRKDVFWFKLDILDYVNSGLSFNINRKKHRLDFVVKILRDYMHNYKEQYKNPIEDIVRPVAKAIG